MVAVTVKVLVLVSVIPLSVITSVSVESKTSEDETAECVLWDEELISLVQAVVEIVVSWLIGIRAVMLGDEELLPTETVNVAEIASLLRTCE